MKKALSFAVALGLVAGLATSAMAEDMLSVKGEARIRGAYINNGADFDDETADKVQEMDQRYRLKAELKINDDVKVDTRIVLVDDQAFGDTSTDDGEGTHTVDRFNMTINMLGGTYIIGRQDLSWGNKFLAWGEQSDRIVGVYKAGDLTFGGYLQKLHEGDTDVLVRQGTGDGDVDVYAAFLMGQAGDTKYGILGNYVYVDPIDADSMGGQLIDAFVNTKIGAAALMGEFVYGGGDTMENSNGDAWYGAFVGGAVDINALTVKGLVAYFDKNEGQTGVSNFRSCDNDFAPSMLIGTCQETAIINFGGTTGSSPDASTYLVGAGADFKINDKLTVGALVGYLMANDDTGGDDATLIEYDLTASYALAQNATYKIGVALGSPDGMSPADDAALAVGHSIEVAW